jgi:hypothetical protein
MCNSRVMQTHVPRHIRDYHHCSSNFMELRPSWEADSCAATQELPSILWKPKVPHLAYKSPSLVPIRSQINPVHTTPSGLSKIHFIVVHPPTSWSSGFSTNIVYSFLFSPFVLHALPISSSSTLSFWLYLANRTSYEAPHYVVFFNLLSLQLLPSKYSPQHPVLKHPQSASETKFRTDTEPQAKL